MEEQIQAGNKYLQEISLPDYAGYTVTKVFNNMGAMFTITATELPVGTFTFLETVTSGWVPGNYITCIYAALDDERYTVKLAKAKILPDFAAGPIENRPFVELQIEAIEAMMAGKATKDQQSMSIAGRTLLRYEWGELRTELDKLKAELLSIDRKTGNADTSGRIYTRF